MTVKKNIASKQNVTYCFVLFSIGKSQVTEYHGIVINDEQLAQSICKKISKGIKRFVDYYKTDKIYQTEQNRR